MERENIKIALELGTITLADARARLHKLWAEENRELLRNFENERNIES